MKRQKEVVLLLPEGGATISSIHEVAALGSQEQVKKFLAQGADSDVKDTSGRTHQSVSKKSVSPARPAIRAMGR